MSILISLDSNTVNTLNLSPVQHYVDAWLTEEKIADYAQNISFKIDISLEPSDPREFSEVPEVRLWFIYLDTCYPWMPYLLNWENGELSRYTAMLVPHQFSKTEGIQYNPEALEIFVMQKVFILSAWMEKQSIRGRNSIKLMTKTLGYELDDGFFELIGF